MATPDRTVPDTELMQRAIAGDRDAYAELFQRNSGRVGRVAYLLLHDSSAAEDIVQETFTRGLDRIRTCRGETPPGAWFCAIGLNLCRRALRDRRRREDSAEPDELESARAVGAPRRGVVTSVARRETSRRLVIALGCLTGRQREVFVLHYVEELPYDIIGRMLSITPDAARALAHRARSVLQERFPNHIPGTLDS